MKYSNYNLKIKYGLFYSLNILSCYLEMGPWSFQGHKKLALNCFEGGRGGGGGESQTQRSFSNFNYGPLQPGLYVLYLCMLLVMWSDLSSMSVLNTNQSMRGKFSDNMQLPLGNEQICNN